MINQYHHDFHAGRAQAERSAADKAACSMTRALHIQLAQLHADRAWHFLGEEISFEVVTPERRKAIFFPSMLAVPDEVIGVAA